MGIPPSCLSPGMALRRLCDGLLPAGKDEHDRRTHLNNVNQRTTEMGGHA